MPCHSPLTQVTREYPVNPRSFHLKKTLPPNFSVTNFSNTQKPLPEKQTARNRHLTELMGMDVGGAATGLEGQAIHHLYCSG